MKPGTAVVLRGVGTPEPGEAELVPVVVLDGHEAETAPELDGLLQDRGWSTREAMEEAAAFLARWDYGEGEPWEGVGPPWGSDDETAVVRVEGSGLYVLHWSFPMGYAGLYRVDGWARVAS